MLAYLSSRKCYNKAWMVTVFNKLTPPAMPAKFLNREIWREDTFFMQGGIYCMKVTKMGL